jgi:mRNA interferase RelE/StbE
LTWKVEWDDAAVKALKKLDREGQRRIFRYLQSRIAVDDDPRRFGKALIGDKAGLWRYRVEDYRIVCQIEDDRLTVLVVTIGHRKLVYQ